MPIIKLPLRFEGAKGKKTLYALFDSGANLSCINEEFANEIANLEAFLHPRKLATASEDHFIKVTHVILSDFYINGVRISDEFLVVPQLSEEVIIGATTMRKWRIKLDFNQSSVFVDPKVERLQII